MLTNYHTHSILCDGNDSIEEMVLKAIEFGFDALGFSGHAYTDFDLSFCMKNTDEYIAEVKLLQEKYKKDIQIYLGIEEEMYHFVNRDDFEYIIGSSHYIKFEDKYIPIDIDYTTFLKCLDVFSGNPLLFAENYFKNFCDYIKQRKPDIIGHFDLITKYEEKENSIFFNNSDYINLAKKYLREAVKSDCLFELNTGAIARGVRNTPYPCQELLYELNKNNGKIILTSDCHKKENLMCYFNEARDLLKDIGFKCIHHIYNCEIKKELL